MSGTDVGISDKLWSMTYLAEMVDAAQPEPGKRSAYKKGGQYGIGMSIIPTGRG